MSRFRAVGASVAAAVLLMAPWSLAQPCEPGWSHEFPAGDLDGLVRCSVVADLGQGPMLYVGGKFREAGGLASPGVAAFDGHDWSAVGGGVPYADTIYSCATYEEGGKALLFAGGIFMDGNHQWAAVVRWDGLGWTQLGGDFSGIIRALAVFDDGSGPSLYAAGLFDELGGQAPGGLVRWDGTGWVLVGGGLSGGVDVGGYALAVWDDGRGPALYVGGEFERAGDVDASGIARWNGHSWEPLGSGVTGTEAYALALLGWNDGTGDRLYVAGWFENAGGIPANNTAVWDGHEWSPMGLGLGDNAVSYVSALATFNEGGGERLYAAGPFYSIPPDDAHGRVARWNGETWDNGGFRFPGHVPRTLAEHKGSLYVGGELGQQAGAALLRRTPDTLGQVGNGLLLGGDPTGRGVCALANADLGHGAELFLTGEFAIAGDIESPDGIDFDINITRLDGAGFHSMSHGLTEWGAGLALSTFNDGTGPSLILGGYFEGVDEEQTPYVDRWDGDQWLGVPDGPAYEQNLITTVNALAAFNDGSGPAVFAAGRFKHAGGQTCIQIAKWDGEAWSPLGAGLYGPGKPYASALCVYDEGGGPALFAGGSFSSAGAEQASNIARWNGQLWSALGGGLDGPIRALCVFDDGSGPALFAAGKFAAAGGQPAANIARWDGAEWHAVGEGIDGEVLALAVFDDGTGPALYIGGTFSAAGGQPASNLARFDGAAWTGVGLETDGAVRALLPTWEGGRGILWVGGSFLRVGGISSGRIAKLEGCACYADFDGSGMLDLADFLLFQALFATQDPKADCDASGGWDLFDFLCFTNAFNAGC